METNWLKTKKATTIFAIVALIGGFSFIAQNTTGKVIFEGNSTISTLTIIGLLLIGCSVVLAAYSLKKR